MSTGFTVGSKMFLTIMAVWIFFSLAADKVGRGALAQRRSYFPGLCFQVLLTLAVFQCVVLRLSANGYVEIPVELKGGKRFCINPKSQWLKSKRDQVDVIIAHPAVIKGQMASTGTLALKVGGGCISQQVTKRFTSDPVGSPAQQTQTARSKMFLTIMAVWIFLAVADVTCQGHVQPTCCDEGTDWGIDEKIIHCWNQRAGAACKGHFYIIEVSSGKRFCINPNSQWMKDKIEKENLKCQPTNRRHQQKPDLAAKTKKKH
ncbi:hypothetical protein CCH79_00003950 [Gambusia affinis]|uniref:Chemokine interleukin-8-like domain-containing protein n=1 Tax=Gambusia affinis TaxID=33528 RepID=A0A315V509_GAMAF|nr:hypothetical protein CCH79_00003950 [Gambusia affinis]